MCSQLLLSIEYLVIKQKLYCQKYWDSPPNHWIQVFQSPPWPQVYKIKHLGMQTASTKHLRKNGLLSGAQ
ncbi:unnamed protein product [Staurois parvus]|uniref:Uncharacterized protein n=1 Tax=Staurois parvus TaxID=386267 RepID=A0ABN9HJ78_9NEOB|nr:unnamed protein product [Staurois parvus]